MWKYLTVGVMSVIFQSFVGYAEASDGMQKPISMTADGWKPIIGGIHHHSTHYQEGIKYYQNPILKETIRAETLPTTTPVTNIITSVRTEKVTRESVPIPVNIFNHGSSQGKIPPHSKQSPQYFVLPRHGGHGPHIPLNAVTQGRPGQHGILKKNPMKGHHIGNKWIVKKPLVGQLSSQSSRNEVYVPAPSTGTYSFMTQGKNVRTRESSGLGTVGHKQFSIKQPHSHLDYSSHFPPKNLFHHNSPVQHLIFQKQQANEVIPSYQLDAPNLLPPPIFKNFEKNQIRHVNAHLNPEIQTPNDKIIFGHNPLGPNDLILQLPSYDQSLFNFGKQKHSHLSGVHITKEKLKTFHNDLSPKFNMQPIKEFDENYHSFQKPMTEYPKSPTYEVTEDKWEDNTPPPKKFHKHSNIVHPVELNFPPFLPTPYKPDITISTSPTQEEVSTIFDQLSNNVKQYSDSYTHDPYLFDVKEVSTHYPIIGTPVTVSTTEAFSEGATGKPPTKAVTEGIPTTTQSSKPDTTKPVKIHSKNRRRRPSTRYTTTTQQPTEDITENENISTYTTDDTETERPNRSRRPIKIRPVLSISEEESDEVPPFNRIRDRHRKRPSQGDLPKKQHRKRVRPSKTDLHEELTTKSTKLAFKEEDITILPIVQHFTTENVKEFEKDHSESTFTSEAQTEYLSNNDESFHRKEPTHYYSPEQSSQEMETVADNNTTDEDTYYRKRPEYNNDVSTSVYENDKRNEQDTISPSHVSLKNFGDYENATAIIQQVNPHKAFNVTESSGYLSTSTTSEYELESSTLGFSVDNPFVFGNTNILKAISEPTTTVISTTSTKSHRRRPIKYNASNRPRFSVKDYRQRLSQYSSTTTSTVPTKSSTENLRLRFPTRLRRPLSTTVATTQASDETTRMKFTPKEPRHGQPHLPSNELIKEKNVKAVNTRLRPFGRTKTTTEQPFTVSSKVSIKPNLFSNRRRPLPISLKSRITNRNNTKPEDAEIKEYDVTTEINILSESSSSGQGNPSFSTEDKSENLAESVDDFDTTPSSDIMKNDAFLYSQRVSDLTSSMKNTYDGFKTIPTSSRRIPNYYTLSTEDPILPIEAFFSNINEKE